MILGIGVDICEVKRFNRLSEDKRFIKRIFSDQEIDYCEKFKKKAECFAARFAAKEAFIKALGIGLSKGIVLKEIEVKKEKSGQPVLKISGATLKTFNNLKGDKIFLSMSHEKTSAVAFVIITKGQN